MRKALNKCALPPYKIQKEITKCEQTLKTTCVKNNPFLLESECPTGYNNHSPGKCLALCPTNFDSASDLYCKKPESYLIDFKKLVPNIHGVYKHEACLTNYQLEGTLCVPQCPKNTVDYGNWCEREIHRSTVFKYLLE